jgi:hypothetical protein
MGEMGAEAAYNTSFVITSQPAISLTDEAMTDSGDHTTYTITNQEKRFLDINTPVVVQTSPDGVTWTTVSNYTLKHVNATVIFNSALSSGTQVRLHSGAFYSYSMLGGAHTAEFASKVVAIDVTVFNPSGVESYIGGPLSGTFKSSNWWMDIMRAKSLTNRDLIAVSFVTPSGRWFSGYVIGTDLGIKSDVKSAVGQDLTFQLTNEFFASSGGIIVTIQDVDILQVGGSGIGLSNPVPILIAIAGAGVSNTNPIPAQDIEQSGYIALVSPPANTNAGSDTPLTFSQQVSRVIFQNNYSATIYFDFDQTSSTASFQLLPGTLISYPKKCTSPHVYTTAAVPLNAANGLIVRGAM